MTTLLGTLSVFPHHHQVLIQVEDATDLPEYGDEVEPVIASAEAIVVATRDNRYGDVTIEVHRGRLANPPGSRVFVGELRFRTPRLEVGSVVTDDLDAFEVGRTGQIPVEIYAEPPEEPERIVVMVD